MGSEAPALSTPAELLPLKPVLIDDFVHESSHFHISVYWSWRKSTEETERRNSSMGSIEVDCVGRQRRWKESPLWCISLSWRNSTEETQIQRFSLSLSHFLSLSLSLSLFSPFSVWNILKNLCCIYLTAFLFSSLADAHSSGNDVHIHRMGIIFRSI